MKFTKQKIKDITEELQIGMIVYIHKETGETQIVPDLNQFFADIEPWEEALEELEVNRFAYFKVEPMSSSEAFKVMERFVEEIHDYRLRNRLHQILNQRKPFMHFKQAVEYDTQIRQSWFEFRDRHYREYVRNHLSFLFSSEK